MFDRLEKILITNQMSWWEKCHWLKENFFDDESESEKEEKIMVALPDSDIDKMENQLININPNYESEEYRWWIEFDKYKSTKSKLFCSDDNTISPPRAIDKMDKLMNNKTKNHESEELR